eukprot:m.269168 g.269168  ORF g.269168 m.269168 type:complete len:59 (+) comp40640_c0_seq1:179-355(+)
MLQLVNAPPHQLRQSSVSTGEGDKAGDTEERLLERLAGRELLTKSFSFLFSTVKMCSC